MASESRGKLMIPKREDANFASTPSSYVNKRPNGSVTDKAKAVASVSKAVEVKGKSRPGSSKTATKKTATPTKGPKKTYTLPGQKYDIPEEREPLRIFYESLSKQIPSSEMAEFWMMEHGLLSPDRAKRAFEKKQRRQQQIRSGTPVKPIKLEEPRSIKKLQSAKPIKLEKPESLKKLQPAKDGELKAKKRVLYSDDDDDDDYFLVKRRK